MNNAQVRVAIAGAGGRMGRQLIQAVLQTSGVELGAALEHECSSIINIDAGELVGLGKTGIKIQSNLITIKDNFEVFIDFTCPESTMKHLNFCYQHNKAMVIGTTGFNDIEKIAIKNASQKIAIVFTANFSVGINIMLKLLEKTAKAIGNYTDIEIIEAHNRHKVDSPSGTAITMGEVIAQAINKDLKTCAIHTNEKCIRKRVPGTINFATIRAGDIIGEHTVMFVNTGERLEITHRASSRAIFANGAIRSALAIKSKNNGLFDMQDILHLNEL